MVLKIDYKRQVNITDAELEIMKDSLMVLYDKELAKKNNEGFLDSIDLILLKLNEISNPNVKKLFS